MTSAPFLMTCLVDGVRPALYPAGAPPGAVVAGGVGVDLAVTAGFRVLPVALATVICYRRR